ncbi:nucleoside-diphosphate sugar epimerase/dehydratase [Synechococcus sp. CS-1332]|uniref:polysaccharide biosynthesis protein n=1 Tax=Synechococcus sp. CS-1332 TaxID=2847972 RepID=UPI00223B7887|nr:nucleoside-diphosphate sugar epimerase/dehydratase [Synechococcus sp. CS-1332]MCT0208544.1 polysaccharide biosynthesis protein [Synechococcus sp. CS-1332]
MIPQLSFLRYVQKQLLARRLLLVVFDGLMIITAYLGAFVLRLPDATSLRGFLPSTILLLPLAVITGLPVLVVSGWYRGLTRYAGSHSLYGLVPRSGSMVLILLLISTLIGGPQPPRSFWILYWLLFTGGAIASRIVLRDVLVHHLDQREIHNPGDARGDATLIYGAGASGMGLLLALRNDPRFRVVGFLDDDEGLQGRTLQNMAIHTPLRLPRLIERHGVSKVLLAMPAMSRRRKRLLVDQLTHSGLEVLSIPSLAQMASGQRIVSDLQAVAIEDLLGREPSNPDPVLLKAGVEGKVVMVTGAGGSIGSELCRQVVALGASRLLLLERNEYALYAIERELSSYLGGVELQAVLGDSCNTARLTLLCRQHGVETIFHAAAYKHVPLVEANLCAGIANNIGATEAVIAAARASGVSRLTLISTDKAVRPTNVMGASKRICELLIQAAAAEVQSGGPILSMVRFGNVLGSSGSVIPLFHQQIARGGPVTVTHPAITRYFMTIPEAVQLVLQATGMAIGGDLFLLDMGEPVRIADLARQMIELSGLRVRDDHNVDGDIAIQYTGLRPGEKLYEELLISADDQPTQHPLIRRATEPRRESEQLIPLIQKLHEALAEWDEATTCQLLRQLVPEYDPEEGLPALPLVDALAR